MAAMPHTHRWRKLLTRELGANEASALMEGAHSYYRRFINSGDPLLIPSRVERSDLQRMIFPSLAMYRSLLDSSKPRSRSLELMELLFRSEFFQGLTVGIKWVSHLPDPFPLVRRTLKMMTRHSYLPGAQMVVQDTPGCFALNTYRCFKLDALTALGAPELTPLYCATDDWLAELMPGVSWERTGTLARGDKMCDFIWKRN